MRVALMPESIEGETIHWWCQIKLRRRGGYDKWASSGPFASWTEARQEAERLELRLGRKTRTTYSVLWAGVQLDLDLCIDSAQARAAADP